MLRFFHILLENILALGVGDTAKFGIDPIPSKYKASIWRIGIAFPYTKVDQLLFKVKSIGIGIGNTGPVFIWYRIDTKFCSIAHPY